jgi:tripartite-type tricarboxylate transporter receptor subunit TctC
MFFDLLPVSLPQINAGKVRALGNAGAKRPAALPDLPTIAEQGLPGFESVSWVGLVAPANTPGPVLTKLAAEVARVTKAPEVVARIHELGSEPGAAFGAEFGAFMAAETKKWAAVIHASGAKAD